MDRNASDGVAKTIAIIALILSLLALGLAYMAYNRTGADLEQRIQNQVKQGANAVEEGAQDAGQAIDAGPDGVDEDDTETGTGTTPAPAPAPATPQQ